MFRTERRHSGRSTEIRRWLRNNNYDDVADKIDLAIEAWKGAGNGTRRNWWDKLAGGKDGKPLRVGGVELPVLRAAQIRKGVPPSPDALCRNPDEVIPPVWVTRRWPRRRRKADT